MMSAFFAASAAVYTLKPCASAFAQDLLPSQAYLLSSEIPRQVNKASGVDALRGNTRSHPEHDG